MNLISHVEIPVRQLERAIGFYSALLEIKFGDIIEMYGNRIAMLAGVQNEG